MDLSEFELPACDVEAPQRGSFGRGGGVQQFGIGVQRVQRIGDILKSGQHSGSIVRRRLVIGGFRGAGQMLQPARFEYRLQKIPAGVPEKIFRLHQVADPGCDGADIRA